MNEEEMKMLAQQLRCPSGEYAKEVGDNMFASNSNMIYQTISNLNLATGEAVLEIGFGNGRHLKHFFEQAENLTYRSIGVSEDMVLEASQNSPETTTT